MRRAASNGLGLPRPLRWLVGVLAVVGAIALVTVVLALFGDDPREPRWSWARERPAPASGDLLLALSGAVNAPIRRGGHARLLVNGVEFVPALLADIGAAKHTVHFMVYVWRPGTMSDLVFDALVERARAGVTVRLLLDGHGAQDAPRDRIAELREVGGQVGVFAPLRFAEIDALHKRNHRRAIVVDGEIGFTGGAAVADTWLGDAQDAQHWRDDLVRVTGPPARSLQAAFAQIWSHITGEMLAGPEVYPLDPAGDAQGDPLLLHIGVVSSPSHADHPLRKVFWLSFAGAQQRIWITTPYFVPDPDLRAILAERARAGVDVRLLTTGPGVDIPVTRWAAHHYYGELLEAGVRIYEYQRTFIHSKLLVVDGVWSVVGSPNLDVRSRELNQENLLTILDARFGRELEETFLRDLESAAEIDLAAWRRRGTLARLREQLAVLLQEQL